MELQEVFNHQLVQDLIDENERLSSGSITQTLSKNKGAKNLNKIRLPYVVKNKVIFSEGTHNGIFYPYDSISSPEALSQIEGIDLFFAEHEDASQNWAGIIKNAKGNDADKTVRGDLEIVDLSAAQKISWMVENKSGTMGLSPTVDVDRRVIDNRAVALDPKYQSWSVVLRPADRTTIFNSEKKETGGVNMQEKSEVNGAGAADTAVSENLSQLKDAQEKNVELSTQLKDTNKQLEELKSAEVMRRVEPLAQMEVDLGKTDSTLMPQRIEELAKLPSEALTALEDSYTWIKAELNEDDDDKDSEEEGEGTETNSAFTDFVKKFIKANPGKTIKDASKAWKAKGMDKKEDNAHIGDDEDEEKRKKKEEEDLALRGRDKKEYPGAEKSSTIPSEGGKERQTLSKIYNLVEHKEQPINRFQLSKETAEGNQQFLDFMKKQQGDA